MKPTVSCIWSTGASSRPEPSVVALPPGSIERWNRVTVARKALPAVAAAAYWFTLWCAGGLHVDLVISSALPLVLFYGGPSTRALFAFALPLCLTHLLYDSQRYFADLIRGPVHVRELYELDKRLFGIPTAGRVLTPNEWFQEHTHAVLDLVTGLVYAVFVPVFVGVAAYFRFWQSRPGHPPADAGSRFREQSPRITWSFLLVNLLGWSTYYWYAASPPWYVAQYGFGPARLDVPANLAGCARFDALLGLPIFAAWYGRAADVHGAAPSLHAAYALLSVYYAVKLRAARAFTLGFFALMCFSAVYLNHHYVVDLIWGSGYALAVGVMTDALAHGMRARIPEGAARAARPAKA